MKKSFLFLMALLWPLLAQQLTLPPAVEKVTDQILKQEYRSAYEYVRSSRLPKVDSLFLTILISNAEMVDYESYVTDGRQFLIRCDSARTAIQKTEEYKRPLLHHYYLATIEGAVAVTRGKKSDFAGALTASNVSKKYFELVLKKDSTFQPAHFGVAMRDYYASIVTSKVGIGKTKLSESIATMNHNSNADNAVSRALLPSLFWIYVDKKMYTEAQHCANRFFETYPNSTIMLRGVAKLQTLTKQFNQSEHSAKRLMNLSDKRSPKNWSDYFSGGVALVTMLIETNRSAEAIIESSRLLAIPIDSETIKLEWVKKHRKRLELLKTEAQSKN